MKTLALLSLIVALAWANTREEEAWCRCGAFVSSPHNEWFVYGLPDVQVNSCDSHNQCKDRCAVEFAEATSDMDLWHMVNETTTVGQIICQDLYDHFIFFIHNSMVHVYSQLCGGPWEYTGLDSQGMLCCNLGQHEHCVSK